jgi:hypothetical protein
MISLFPPTAEDQGGFDPIDLQLDRSGATSRRLDAGVSTALRPPAGVFPGLVLLAGVAMGPHGLALLTPAMLSSMEPFGSVALAVLGVLLGLSMPIASGQRWSTVVTQVEAVVAFTPVLTGLLLFDGALIEPVGYIAAVIVASAAATSSSLRSKEAESDAVAPVAVAGAAIAVIRAASPGATLLLIAQTSALAIGAAIVGWLLLLRSGARSEQRVFVFASILLLGGVADYTSTSALLGGLVGGLCWRAVRGAARDDVQRDMSYVQHPVVVLVLLAAGSRADFSLQTWLISTVYVLTRTTGKLVGGWAAAWMIPDMPPRARLRLIAPGIFGVALALDVLRAGGDAFAPVLSVVVLGTIASSILVAVLPSEERG